MEFKKGDMVQLTGPWAYGWVHGFGFDDVYGVIQDEYLGMYLYRKSDDTQVTLGAKGSYSAVWHFPKECVVPYDRHLSVWKKIKRWLHR